MKYITIAIIFILLTLLTLFGFLIYKSVYEGLFIVEPPPYFNFGTREWYPTRNMSYDIRGEPIIPYYRVSPFYNPEYPLKYFPRNLEYVYDYYIPGLYPPVFDPKYSVPFATNDNKNNMNSEHYSKYK
jgi:hypothetical protein